MGVFRSGWRNDGSSGAWFVSADDGCDHCCFGEHQPAQIGEARDRFLPDLIAAATTNILTVIPGPHLIVL